jgi:hypothetical protein
MATRKTPGAAEKKPATRTVKARTKKTEAAVEEVAAEKKVPTYEEVARLAEQFWIERGRPFGSPEVDWLRAEATLHP